jgi:hypothetical protein
MLVEGRALDQRGRPADGVVLDLVRVVECACGEIARPFPPVHLAVERRGGGWNAVPTDTASDSRRSVRRDRREIYDFGICFSGSTNGRATIVVFLSPSSVSTVRRVPSCVCSIGSHA